jgi:hypothetical protein
MKTKLLIILTVTAAMQPVPATGDAWFMLKHLDYDECRGHTNVSAMAEGELQHRQLRQTFYFCSPRR